MPSDSLLITKLHVPKVQTGLVARSRLDRRLEAGSSTRLTLVCAPAGFGKSTLLAAWSEEQANPVAWVSLDEGDNSATRFLLHLVAALRNAYPAMGETALTLLDSPRAATIEAVLTSVINDLVDLSQPLHLILDDYHVIHEADIHYALAFLLEYLPPDLHLVIASRMDPALPLASLRGRGQLNEIRAEDLRFTRAEATDFLATSMGLELSPGEIGLLEERTEGWIVGLQLAALSLRKEAHPGDFIRAFGGDDRYVIDYLVDEVVARQTPEVQTFLLQTSVADRFCAPLCDALYDREPAADHSQEMLETLEHANLFVIPLDSRREWYRFHHLFADLLRYRLKRTLPERVHELHSRAGRWFEAQGLTDEALMHIRAAGELEWAGDLIERLGVPTLWGRGEVATVQAWLASLPDTLVHDRPRLAVLSAWIKHLSGDFEAIAPLIDKAEQRLGESEPTFGGDARAALAGEITTLRGYLARMRGDLAGALVLHRQAQDRLPAGALEEQSQVVGGLGEVHFLSGRLSLAAECFEAVVELMERSKSMMPAAFCLWRVAEIEMLQGRLRQAHDTCGRMLGFTRRYKEARGGMGYAEVQLGRLAYEANDLEAAAQWLGKGAERGKQLANPRVFLPGLVYSSQILWARGETQAAFEVLREAVEVEDHFGIDRSWGLPPVGAYRARFQLAEGDLAAAARWAGSVSPVGPDDDPIGFSREVECLTLARVFVAQGEPERAVALLERLARTAEAGGCWGRLTEIEVLLALAYRAGGDLAAALDALGRALGRAAPSRYVRLFLDEGEAMHALLERARSFDPAYVDHLLDARGSTASAAPSPVAALFLGDPLSEREQAVLRLLGARLTDKEIAKELSLSVNTIKWYDRNIYSKLGVSTRRQAITKAKSLGLL